MVTTLTKDAIEKIIQNKTDLNEEYVVQALSAPIKVSDQLFKFSISDGFQKTKKIFVVGDAASRQDEIKELNILKVKKFFCPEQTGETDKFVIGMFEVLYSNVTDLIGKPIDQKHYRNNGYKNPEGSIVIPEKYLPKIFVNKHNAAAGYHGGPMQKPAGNNPYGHNKVTQNPQSMYGQNSSNQYQSNNQQQQQQQQQQQYQNQHQQQQQQQQQQQRPPAGMGMASMEDERDLERISQLSPNLDAAFKARVTKKGDVKNFRSQKGEGTLFSVDVIDEYGAETTLSFFNAEAQKYYNSIQVEHVYIFKNGNIKANGNKTFNKGEVVVTMTQQSSILAAIDDGRIPFMQMNRKRINEIQSLEKDKFIDIIGIVRGDTESRVVTLKDNNQKQRRDIKVFDESRMEIEISLWGDKADNVKACQGDIIVIKDARIGEYRDKKQVNLGYNTQIFLNPDYHRFPDAEQLDQWRNKTDLSGLIAELQSKSPSGNNGEAAGMGAVPTMNWESSISQLREEINSARTGNTFSDDFKIWREIRALIHFVKDTPLYYDSCEKCKKKIKADADRWFCENCQVSCEQPTSRYITTILIADSSDQMWVSAYDEVAKKIFGHSANEFRMLGDGNTEQKKKMLQQVHFKEFRLLLLTKSEKDPSTGQYREKTVIQGIKDDQPAVESRRLLNSLDKYIELEDDER